MANLAVPTAKARPQKPTAGGPGRTCESVDHFPGQQCSSHPTSQDPLQLEGTDVRGLWAFRALGRAELHPLTFVE